jgi:hypothetical protein
MEVMSFKMVTGEEVIARHLGTQMSGSKDVAYDIERPQVLSVQAMQGRMGLAFIPWALSNPDIDKISVPASAVVVMFKPSEMIEKQYLQETSKIALT